MALLGGCFYRLGTHLCACMFNAMGHTDAYCKWHSLSSLMVLTGGDPRCSRSYLLPEFVDLR